MEERLFWETMNPARLHALYNARFGLPKRTVKAEPESEKPLSLSEYLRGG